MVTPQNFMIMVEYVEPFLNIKKETLKSMQLKFDEVVATSMIKCGNKNYIFDEGEAKF